MCEVVKIEPYRGYAKLEPVGNDDWAWLVFPLSKTASFLIGTSPHSDLLLPPVDNNVPVPVAILHVDEDGKVSLENASNPWSCGESLKVSGTILLTKEICNLTEKATVEFGPYTYSFQFTDTPTARYMKFLFDTVKCAICSEILTDPRSLPCTHAFCNNCIAKLVDDALLSALETEFQMETKAVNQKESTISCPTCEVKVSVARLKNESKKLRNYKALAEITKTIRELNDERAFCVQCSNKRCLMHGSDYAYCENCQATLCPLCAMDGHREHELRSFYIKAFRNGQPFVKKCTEIRQDWMEIYKRLELNEIKVKKALKSAVTCVDILTGVERKLDEATNNLNKFYAELVILQSMRWDIKLDSKRNEMLNLFQKKYETFLSSSNPLLANLNAKAEVILNPTIISNFLQDNQIKSMSADSATLLSANSSYSSLSTPNTKASEESPSLTLSS